MSVIEFLSESNKIESVYDDRSLADAKNAWQYLASQKVITIPVIKQVHKILMENQKLERKYIGAFRDCPVYVGGRECLRHRQIPTALVNWITKVKKANDWEDIKKLHVEYERIHPFVDGNGRTGRLFMNWHRITLGLPVLVIHEGIEQQEYYEWFR